MQVFDRQLLRMRRARAARNAGQHDFLFREVANRLCDRMDDIQRTFPVVLDLGGAHGVLSAALEKRKGTQAVITCDSAFDLVCQGGAGLVAEEEALPFAKASLDGVISNLALHWVNDLPGALLQIRNVLKPDGLFMCAVLGGETLRELRTSLLEAEAEIAGGVSPRVSPFIDLRDMGALMQRAGFALPVVDGETITVDYSSPFKLMHDLRGMGATNATLNRSMKPLRKSVLMEAARLYHERYGDADGRVPATFEIIYAIGWAPHASQQKPLMPGSAKSRLADALKTTEISAGEKP